MVAWLKKRIPISNLATDKPLQMHPKPPAYLLPLIVFAQFAGTSLWFAGNAIIHEIQRGANASTGIANLTSLVQLGFISGTLAFAVLSIADRFKAPLVFFISSCLAALANATIIVFPNDLFSIGLLRFITGFFLAGIYPVGMKIAADWFPRKLGNALGFLVGALVLGTAFPHLLTSQFYSLPWKQVLLFTSLLALTGGLLVLFLIPAPSQGTKHRFQPAACLWVFRSPDFRSAAFGYFGHMWELYTFWAFIPLILQVYNASRTPAVSVPFWSFILIAAGSLGCIAGGILSKTWGSKKVAFVSLAVSGLCCCLAPFFFSLPAALFLSFLLVWGITVVSDSPQFSSLVAQSAIQQYKGTALTIVTCVGFTLTIISIQLMKTVFEEGPKSLWLLAAGPLVGLIALHKAKKNLPAILQAEEKLIEP